jgi:hypothetical protein
MGVHSRHLIFATLLLAALLLGALLLAAPVARPL